MILSLLTMDLSSPSVRQSFQNCQDLHRNIMKAFDVSRQEGKVLFRVVRSEKSIQVYVQSEAEPHWRRIEENGYRCEKQKDVTALLDAFREEIILNFSLYACPAKKTPAEGKNSRRVLLQGEEEQIGWLKKQGEKYGFEILEAHKVNDGEKQAGKKDSGTFYVAGVPFEGVLRITDATRFRKAYADGIGAEKAYGFGLLMVSKR